MFDVGFGEIILILIVALMVVGPGNLPKAARTLGRAVAWLRHLMLTLQREINMEIRQIEMADRERRTGPNVRPPTPPSGGPAYDQSESPVDQSEEGSTSTPVEASKPGEEPQS